MDTDLNSYAFTELRISQASFRLFDGRGERT